MKYFIILCLIISLAACNESKTLPILGNTAQEGGKTIYHHVRDWSYLRQDSVVVTNDSLKPYIYITDFFFTSCPSICPKVTKEMLKVYDAYKNDDRVKLVSFTIDPKRDTPEKLKTYAANLQVDQSKWWFLQGEKDFTYELANDYFIVAFEDAESPGGFDHSGKIILVDQKGQIRSFSEGTDPETTPKLIADIQKLLDEQI